MGSLSQTVHYNCYTMLTLSIAHWNSLTIIVGANSAANLAGIKGDRQHRMATEHHDAQLRVDLATKKRGYSSARWANRTMQCVWSKRKATAMSPETPEGRCGRKVLHSDMTPTVCHASDECVCSACGALHHHDCQGMCQRELM